MPEIRPEICRGIWAALASARMQTLDDLQIVTGIQPEEFWPYIDLLWRQGYLGLVSIRRAASGEAIVVFRLAKHTGPQAPYLDEAGKFVDPNLPGDTNRLRSRWGTFPSLMARIRVAGERLTHGQGNFTRDELFDAVGLNAARPADRQEFSKCWWRLKREGGLQALPGDRFRYELSAAARAIREFFRVQAGRDVPSGTVRVPEKPGPVGAALKRQALDLLAAEGYRIAIRTAQFAEEETIYRVDAPEDTK